MWIPIRRSVSPYDFWREMLEQALLVLLDAVNPFQSVIRELGMKKM